MRPPFPYLFRWANGGLGIWWVALRRFSTVHWIESLQWPAMAATLLSAWLVAGQSKSQRQWGFWIFLLSNVLWAAWGWQDRAWALIVLQIGLAILNIRGVAKNDRA